MDNVTNEYYDLRALLAHGDIDIRRFAADQEQMTAMRYFTLLSEFLKLAPAVNNSLAKFVDVGGEKEDYRNVNNMINLLTEMGCDKFVIEFHSALDTYGKKGNWRESAAYAKQAADDFNKFYLRVKSARTARKPALLIGGAMTLYDYIGALDKEERDRKPTILAIDDSPVILNAVSSILSRDYKVYTLTRSGELKKILQKLTPELFLMDYQMPEFTGFDLMPIIRDTEGHKDTPVIFLTSFGAIDNVTTAIALGAADFIVKPFTPETLLEKVAKHIKKKTLF